MKAIKIIGIILASLILILAFIVFMQPEQGVVEKSIVINASQAKIYQEVIDFKKFENWSPWMKMDPQSKITYEGPDKAIGSKMNWEGEKIGRGSQWVEDAIENQKIKTGLSFEGYDGQAYAEMILTPEGEGTRVTWIYKGSNSGISGKAMWLVMGSMLGGQYEQGLNDLKKYVESIPNPPDSIAH